MSRRTHVRPSLEALEDRLVPATLTSTFPTLQPRDLVITGTDAPDNVRVSQTFLWLTVTRNGVATNYSSVGFDRIIFDGRGGNDFFVNDTSLPAVAHGGTGNDVLHGGGGNDLLYGDADSDGLDGRGGNDILYAGTAAGVGDFHFIHNSLQGGPGNDTLYGAEGNDGMLGGDNDDALHGYAGDDVVGGGPGNDVLYGGLESDVVVGDAGNDTLYAGDAYNSSDLLEADTLFGDSPDAQSRPEDGNDTLFGKIGPDSLFGGGAVDILKAVDGRTDFLDGGADQDVLHADRDSAFNSRDAFGPTVTNSEVTFFLF